MQTHRTLLYSAWKKLIRAYVISLIIGVVIGALLVTFGQVRPERLFAASTQRIAHAFPIFEAGLRHGIDMGILVFVWNIIGALATLSFIHTALWFDPGRLDAFPQRLRRVFHGKSRMKLLCHLPGCAGFEPEPLRRLYVWLMVPLLGILLLGIESGLQVSTVSYMHGSCLSAVIALLPHGLIEIPAFALAGSVAYSAHLLMAERGKGGRVEAVFQQIEKYRRSLPLGWIALVVSVGLFVAGLVEAHVTPQIMQLV